MRVVLGWKPIFIEQQMFNTRSDISKDLIIGTGYTLNLDKLFHLPGRTNETSANLRLALNLTNSMTRALGSSQLPRSMPAGNDMVMNRLNNRLRESNAEAEKLRKANEKLEQVLRSNIERERHDRSMSPGQIMHQQPVVQSIVASLTPNDFERQYLGKMDKLLDTITEMQRNQNRQPPPQYNQPQFQQPNNMMFQQSPGQFGRQPMATVPGGQRFHFDSQANQTRSMLMNDQQSGGINRVDRAGYIDAGIKGLIDPFGMNDPALQNLNLKVEFDDPKKICTITLQFLGIKYLVPGNDLKQFNFRIPDRVYFTFDFFTCPVFRTKNLTYMNTNLDELHQQPSSFLDRQMILINEDFSKGSGTMKEPIVQFEVNPMKEGTTSVYDSLVEYLAKKELMIDVWDGDSLMHFGRANYKLHNLLRQGKDTEMCSPTLEIFDQQTKVMRGTIQMSLKNQAIMLDSRSEACPPEKVHFHFNRAQRSGKYKVKSFKPLDIKKDISQGFDQSRAISDAELNDEEYRKKLRIDRFKIMRSQMPAGPATDSRITPDIQSFNQSLREVEAIRERKKPEVISNAMTKGYSDEHQISGIFGHPKYVTYKFENVTKQIMDYKVKIEHSKNCIPEEFTLVRSPREWEFMCNELRVDRPSEWGMLEHIETFSLMAGDSITLIFKFLSFDEETLKQGKGVDKVASINITDYSGQVICGISFTFHLRHPIIDRTLTFYEMENRISSLELPPFYTSINTTYPQ